MITILILIVIIFLFGTKAFEREFTLEGIKKTDNILDFVLKKRGSC